MDARLPSSSEGDKSRTKNRELSLIPRDTDSQSRDHARRLPIVPFAADYPPQDDTRRRRSRSKKPSKKPQRASAPLRSETRQSLLDERSRSFLPALSRIVEGKRLENDTQQRMMHSSSSRHKGTSRMSHEKNSRLERNTYDAHKRYDRRVRGLASPSMQSVLSSLTAATSSSSGSNSTVTQRSYASDRSRRHRASPIAKSRGSTDQSMKESKANLRRRESRESINVFNYLQSHISEFAEEEDTWQSSASSSDDDESSGSLLSESQDPMSVSSASTPPSPTNMEKRSGRNTIYTIQEQLHSDSGISMRSSSQESLDFIAPKLDGSYAVQAEIKSNGAGEVTGRATDRFNPLIVEDPGEQRTPRQKAEARFDHGLESSELTRRPSPLPYTEALEQHRSTSTAASNEGTNADPRGKVVDGHAKLASKLSGELGNSRKIQPLYRRFEALNHRILLHLQDEISEMEEELSSLDQHVYHISNMAGVRPRAASRRSAARLGGELEYQRTDLLGRIFMKVKQYSEQTHVSQTDVLLHF
ncbi:MAG: hypothetical protein M1828_003227 [Chrysothrix sp. TS-e1954]|nr:MAG: hypothetical protein M1828_003227 [Chrysothrix sp. TS-e1954]